ncbi:MAG: tryptophan--tRNA ligase [Elusimicrobia bacterium]|nr:tryptophan--tRNA ligase [Elusimicrobiota bacterium]
MEKNKTIVVSGMRPTGRLHLGNYWGALKNWISLQDKHSCYFFVADWHALTTGQEKSGEIRKNSVDMVIDWLTAGLDPEKCVIFRQSDIKEHAELYLLLGMVAPITWLLRNPSFKEQLMELYAQKYKGQEVKMKETGGMSEKLIQAHTDGDEDIALHSEFSNYGFLGYPVLQAADIFMYSADYVPVGKDQLPHLELSREIARRFNHVFGRKVFKEPEPLLTESPVVPGIDARKMSKSYGNTIELGEEQKSLETRIRQMYTDPAKVKANDKGHPEGCVVFAFHGLYNSQWPLIERECREGMTGCVACKKRLLDIIGPVVSEFREKRLKYEKNPSLAENVLKEGAKKAVQTAAKTMEKANNAAGI